MSAKSVFYKTFSTYTMLFFSKQNKIPFEF